jgi:hypothetical protein
LANLPPWPQYYAQSLVLVSGILFLVLVLVPRFLWGRGVGDPITDALARSLWTLAFFSLLVHLLVTMRAYEGLTFVVALIMVWLWRIRRHLVGNTSLFRDIGLVAEVELRAALHWLASGGLGAWARERRAQLKRPSVAATLTALAIVAPMLVAARQQFTDNFTRISPAFSDAEVTIKWMRLLENSYEEIHLYVDGVYPLGMYTLLSLVRKLSLQNPVVVLQTTGPMVGFALVLVGAAAVFIMTRRPLAAAIYAWLYGTMSGWLPVDIERHAGHNSQEFAMLFILPAAAFSQLYLTQGVRFYAGATGGAVLLAVLTHPIATLFVVLAVCGPTGISLLRERFRNWRQVLILAAACALGALGGALPPLIGVALGLPTHGSSTAYATERFDPAFYPGPPYWMVAVLAASLLLAFWHLVWRRRFADPAGIAALGLGASTLVGMAVAYSPLLGIPARVLYDRGRDPASMLLAAAAGAAFALLCSRALKFPRIAWVPPAALLGAMALAWYVSPPAIARPPRVFDDAALYQYMRIWNAHDPGSWAMVAGPDAYTLAIARANHYYPEDLNTKYEIGPEGVREIGQQSKPVKLDLYFFIDWSIPDDPQSAERGVARITESEKIQNWVHAALERGLPLALRYRDPTLQVWSLEYKPEPADLKKELRSVGFTPAERVGKE